MNLYKNLIIFSLPMFVTILNSCNYGKNCVNANGHEVTQTRTLDEFSGIDVGGSVKVFLKQGPEQSVRITASDNIQELIRTRVRGGKLILDLDRDVCRQGDITAYLTVKNLDEIGISGSVDVVTENQFNIDDLDISISGSTNMKLNVNAKNIRTSCSGGSEIEMKGTAASNKVDVSGSVHLKAWDMPVGRYDVSASGSSEMEVFAVNELNVEASGSSNITYRGNPKSVTNTSSGSSSLKKRD